MGKLLNMWKGLTFDEKGKFSTKRAAYVVGLGVGSYIVLHVQVVTWDLLLTYFAYCSGPSSFREFMAFKANKPSESKE